MNLDFLSTGRRGRVNASASDGGMSLPHSIPQHLSPSVPHVPIPVICDAHTTSATTLPDVRGAWKTGRGYSGF